MTKTLSGLLAVVIALLVALLLATVCSNETRETILGGDETYHEDLDSYLARAYACVVDDETDADEKSECVADVVWDLRELEGLNDADRSIVRRLLVLMEGGTPFIVIRDGIIDLRQEVVQ